MDDKLQLSIVIPTKNRAAMLRTVLESIKKQKADPKTFEVIVIDNGSTDETKSIAGEYSGQIRNYRYIYDARPGLHVGRNRGLLESRGELVGYLDDDVILFPNWVNAALETFADKEVMFVGGSVIPYDMSLITEEFLKKYGIRKGTYQFVYPISCFWQTGISENDTRTDRIRGSVFGGNGIYRKSVLCECRGFHPDGMPNHLLMYRGDGETYVQNFMFKHKMKALYNAQTSVYHMIDVNRVSDSYISYMHFRNGISSMYTCLREGGIKGGMMRLKNMLMGIMREGKIESGMRGELYLLAYYIFYKRIRVWVHKEDYF